MTGYFNYTVQVASVAISNRLFSEQHNYTSLHVISSRVYIGMYIHDCMTSDYMCLTITNNLKQTVPSCVYYLILKLSIITSLYGIRVYLVCAFMTV